MIRITILALLMIVGLCACQTEIDPTELERTKHFEEQLRDNMRTAQVAAERYAADHGGTNYPTVMDDVFKTYFPGGQEGRVPAPVGPVNPFTGENEFPTISRGVTDPVAARDGKRMDIPRGKIHYFSINNGKGYAILGGAHDDKALMDKYNPDKVLVFSNLL